MYPEDRMAAMNNGRPLIRHSYPNEPTAVLDPKDERLIQLSAQNGFLEGRNSILETDCAELREKNRRLNEQLSVEINDNKKHIVERDDYREKYYESDREVDRLRQYEPKKEETNEGNNLPSSES